MKTLMASLLVAAVFQVNAQKNIDGLINSEKSFAAYSVAHGTKEAFLQFLDSNGIVFDQGKAVNGMVTWQNRQSRSAVLNWWPQYVEIASSDDFGYTSGPWQLQPTPTSDSVIARGLFTTVWHTDAKGQWKFLLDLGISNSPKESAFTLKKIKGKKVTGEPSTSEVLNVEHGFINSCLENKARAYKRYSSNRILLLRNGRLSANSVDDQATVVKQTPSTIHYTIMGSGIATSGDLAYVYGNTLINDKTDNYLRIWRKEKDGWKLALEVLRY